MEQHLSDKNVALDLIRVTEAAALASARTIGYGDKEAVDAVAVEAMKIAFQGLHIKGVIVVGEGEKDRAPMLHPGDMVGFGDGPQCQIAVDPVDGTTCVAQGHANSISAAGLVEKGKMFDPGHSYYCQKIIVGPEAANVIDLDAPVKDNLQKIAKAVGKTVSDLRIYVLDKPRHKKLIQDIRIAGARAMIQREGDIAGAIMAVSPQFDIDAVMGIGGTPEAVVSACALKGSGGQMLIRLCPQSDEEKKLIEQDGNDLKLVRGLDDIISSDHCYFSATGVTSGPLLDGVKYHGEYAITHSIATRGRTGTMRYIQAWHDRKKLSKMSSINY